MIKQGGCQFEIRVMTFTLLLAFLLNFNRLAVMQPIAGRQGYSAIFTSRTAIFPAGR